MNTSTLSFDEIQEAEKASEARKGHRNAGFRLMKDRDLGHQRLSNGVVMRWHVPPPVGIEDYPTHAADGTEIWYQISNGVPKGMVEIDGKIYDAENLRKWLRWA